MKCCTLFSGNSYEKYFKMSSAGSLACMLSIVNLNSKGIGLSYISYLYPLFSTYFQSNNGG